MFVVRLLKGDGLIAQAPEGTFRAMKRSRFFPTIRLIAAAILLGAVIVGANVPVAGYLGIGRVVDPVHGLYGAARSAAADLRPIDSGYEATTTVAIDNRGVPHIFADSETDAVRALGFAVARDRLFQLEYLPRVASGRLSEILGEAALDTDRFLRRTEMGVAAKRNLQRIESENGIELALLNAFSEGVNAYIESLERHRLPIEYRLLGVAPERYEPLKSLLVLQLMTYDLSYRPPDDAYLDIVSRYGRATYDSLYPSVMPYSVPIVSGDVSRDVADATPPPPAAPAWLAGLVDAPRQSGDGRTLSDAFPGHIDGVGSNNWVVGPPMSTTGGPLLAGDMHLSLTVPPIWYEARLVTPETDVRGVTIPGAPVIVTGITDSLAWSFTNTASDQIDHFLLREDSTGANYLFEGEWLPFEQIVDTFAVRGEAPRIETRRRTRFGPVIEHRGAPIAIRWVGHRPNGTIVALREMNRATSIESFETAIRLWDSPMQNIAYADNHGRARIRTTGFVPVRRAGDGCGLLDGTSDAGDWVGRVPFESLPVAIADAGYAASANQRPTLRNDIYLHCRWQQPFRASRINTLLSSRSSHSLTDMQAYQSDVLSEQARLFVPLLGDLELAASARGAADELAMWDRVMDVASTEATLFSAWMDSLQLMLWDEPGFTPEERPHLALVHKLLVDDNGNKWFDRRATPARESGNDILKASFEAAAASAAGAKWGDVHSVTVRHVSRLTQLKALWRGPYPYPGYVETLSPGPGKNVVHSASWRVVVDLSTVPPTAYGSMPGGQSGDPLSPFYDSGLDAYLRFDYHPLERPRDPSSVGDQVIVFEPQSR